MNTIIYSKDFEPITAIDLPIEVLDSAERKGGIMLALSGSTNPDRLIRIDCVKLQWVDGSQKPVLIAHQEELALLLKPDWLVGQRMVIRAYDRTLKILTDKIKKIKPED
jgi:hypothetical protein